MTPQIVDAVNFLTKIIGLIGIGLYGVFAAVLVRQEQLMAAVLEESFEPILRLLVVVHFAASVALFILAVLIL